MIISTCNRTEIYFEFENHIGQENKFLHSIVKELVVFKKYKDSLSPHLNNLTGSYKVANHLFRLVSGLESMIIGEFQIVEQLKDAYYFSKKHKMLGPILGRMIQKSLETGKYIRTNTEIGRGAVSVSYAAVEQITNKYDLKNSKLEKENSENLLKDKYKTQICDRDEAIERLKDMKAKLSTKMVGETLEQHCENEFNKLRSTAFQTAYFDKDNDSSAGSKGDYIFKDHDENGTEIISIMFEMKNEMDTTATKRKNEDFLQELDKDRNEKGCEYAVLVSLLEPEGELYNTGIVDVFY